MDELIQLYSGMTVVWLKAAFIVCIFGVLVFRPDRIHSLTLFQIACILFTLSLFAPGLIEIGLSYLIMGTDGMGSVSFDESQFILAIGIRVLDPMLFASSFLTAIFSLLPTIRSRRTATVTATATEE